MRSFQHKIVGVASLVATPTPIDQWAEQQQLPNRKVPNTLLTGKQIQKLTGIESKSWDKALFGNIEVVVRVAKEALQAAQLDPKQVDAVLLVTGTPYQVLLDVDSFRVLRALGIPDHVPPLQLNAGCCGMARAMNIVSQLDANKVLIVAYEVSSPYFESYIYRNNDTHPMADMLPLSPVLFSDGVGAVVLTADAQSNGFTMYSRDSQSFGDDPGFLDPLVYFLGGGAECPPGTPGAEQMSCYAVSPRTKEYYHRGMILNHQSLLRHRPGYAEEVKRIYIHQASPRLVSELTQYLTSTYGISHDKLVTNASLYGNLVSPSTIKLLHDDLVSGVVSSGDEVCVSVVGAGPERGAYLITVA